MTVLGVGGLEKLHGAWSVADCFELCVSCAGHAYNAS